LVIVVIVALLAFLFWKQVNSAVRGIYPGWPFVFAIPILVYAYSHPPLRHHGGSLAPRVVGKLLERLLRANLAVPLGGETLQLYVFCHGIPERCLTIRGHALPICARCTGLLIGIAAGCFVPIAPYLGSGVSIGLVSLLVGPFLVDGITQLAGLRESTNPLRLVTGVIGGVGLVFGAQVLRAIVIGF
jgi:uncharacterized membrane protein